MSLSQNDRNLRARDGKNFPIDPAADVDATFATVIADALRKDFGDQPAQVKQIARLTGTNARTVQNWLQARNGPNGAGLVILMRHSDGVAAAVLELAGRRSLLRASAAEKTLKDLDGVLRQALRLIDTG